MYMEIKNGKTNACSKYEVNGNILFFFFFFSSFCVSTAHTGNANFLTQGQKVTDNNFIVTCS